MHRFLELLFRTMPLVQHGPFFCKLVFDKIHQFSKAQLTLSNRRNPSSYSMQRWREAEALARVVSYPQKFEVAKEWFLNAAGKIMKAVSRHMCGPRVILPEEPSHVCAHTLHCMVYKRNTQGSGPPQLLT